jgi:rRNA-processing protein FCF1
MSDLETSTSESDATTTVPHVVVDTNALFGILEHGKGMPAKIQDLLKLLQQHGRKLFVHDMVAMELETNWERNVEEARRQFNQRTERFGVELASEILEPFRDALVKRIRSLKDHAAVQGMPFGNDVLRDVAYRWRTGRKPFRQAGSKNSLGDAIIWLGSISFLEQHARDKPIALISGNVGDFAGDDEGTQLHPQLVDDADRAHLQIEYFRSIDDFLRRFSSAPVTGIAQMINNLDESRVRQAIEERIRAFGDWIDPDDPYLYEHYRGWGGQTVKGIEVVRDTDYDVAYTTSDHAYLSYYAIVSSRLLVGDHTPSGRPGPEHEIDLKTKVHFQVIVDAAGNVIDAHPLSSRTVVPDEPPG